MNTESIKTTERLLKTFTEDWFQRFWKFGFIVLFAPMFIYVDYLLAFDQIPYELGRSAFFSATGWALLFCGGIIVEYICLVLVRDIINSATTLDVYEEHMVGHTYFKRSMWELSYTNIKKIYPSGNQIRYSLVLEDIQGHHYKLSILMDYLKECILYIKSKATNLELYHLDNIPDNKFEWRMSDDPIIKINEK